MGRTEALVRYVGLNERGFARHHNHARPADDGPPFEKVTAGTRRVPMAARLREFSSSAEFVFEGQFRHALEGGVMVPGWRLEQWLTTTRTSRIARARSTSEAADDPVVLLKVAAGGDPAEFRREYALAQSLSAPGIFRPRSLLTEGSALAMVLDDGRKNERAAALVAAQEY